MRLLVCQLELIGKKKWHFRRATHPEATSSFEMVELSGYIVGLKRAIKKISFTIDDGTGLVDCTLWDASIEEFGQEAPNRITNLLDVGDSIAVRGQFIISGRTREIKVQWIGLLSHPEAECMHWMESILSW